MAIYLPVEKRKELEATNECYMLGVLENFNENENDFEQFTIMNNSDSIAFYVKPISDRPTPITEINNYLENDEYFIGIDKHIISSPIGMPISYKYSSDYDEKVKVLKEKLMNKLIVFRPSINIKKPKNNNEEAYLVYKNLEIVSTEEIPDIDIKETNFIPIPYVKYKVSDFDEMLSEGQHVVFSDYSDKYFQPEYILCQDYLYFDFKGWKAHSSNKKSWKCTDEDNDWKKVKLYKEDLSDLKRFIRASDNLFFINSNYAQQITENYEDRKDEDISTDLNYYEECNSIMAKISNKKMITDENEEGEENKFINAFEEYTLSKGLSYSKKDLVNFHICMKTNLITILTGMTGTGKSELARAYAKMLNLSSENENLLFMPISPNYNEPSDVIGYLNTALGLYNSSETGLLDFIIKASNNPEKLYMVVFDEMNLSQVEHWFAPFISLLEVEQSERFLTLYSYKTKCLNDSQYPYKVNIGSNIRFVGTMNVDETTKDISDRLLDRANTITLDKISFRELISNIEKFDSTKSDYQNYICTKYEEYRRWIHKDDSLNVFSKYEIDFFDKLHELIINYDSQKGVSFRVLQRIGIYIKNIPSDEHLQKLISREDAFDLQVKQRIITKIKGTSKQFLKLIGTYEFDTTNVINSKLLELLNSEDSKTVSNFKETKKEINRKAQELALYGYTN